MEFIQNQEGFNPKPYYCDGKQLSSGFGTRSNGNEIISKDEADKRMRKYLDDITWKKFDFSKIKATDAQKIALGSFDYNTDKGLNLIIDGKVNCQKILLYDKVCEKVNGKKICKKNYGLEKRRKIEYDLCKS